MKMLERRFKPIESLKQIVENIEESQPIKKEADVAKDIDIKKKKREDSDDNNNTTNKDSYWTDVEWLKLTPPKKQSTKQLSTASDSFTFDSTPTELSKEPPIESSKESPKIPLFVRNEDVFETKDISESLETTIKQSLQTQTRNREGLHQLGSLGRKYVSLLLGDDTDKTIDCVYGVYFDKSGTMFGDKKFDKNDSIIIDNVRYNDTPLYELIFKRLSFEVIFTEDDKQTYKSILLTMNAHRRGHSACNPIMGNKRYKYYTLTSSLRLYLHIKKTIKRVQV
ncbi:hypothetical protein P5V15_005870 [Pogonomyrmex californicus]